VKILVTLRTYSVFRNQIRTEFWFSAHPYWTADAHYVGWCSLKVCDGAGDPCDSVCGGAGCGKCGGGVSCDEGAVTKSLQAIDLANQSESILVVKKREIESVFNRVSIGFHLFKFSAALRLLLELFYCLVGELVV